MKFDLAARVRPYVTLIAIAIAGCSSSPSGEDACHDAIDAFTDVGVRCGFDGRQMQIQLEATFQCAEVSELDNEETFYENCLPGIRNLTCEELVSEDDTFPLSCRGQFIVKE